ncbi:MAG TPA: hypothetical protein VK735_46410 [Pseudonocardia sp.]|uniref:hypothetical protein n=1 Tax=Pseudonocardia sp. TaxID=60912 RepID=UPI002B97BFED|nr:hypothetical protein [Pseudonocardia sp.]HTF54924.1 hypothetical protein [Pseudonocardia sp.]
MATRSGGRTLESLEEQQFTSTLFSIAQRCSQLRAAAIAAQSPLVLVPRPTTIRAAA